MKRTLLAYKKAKPHILRYHNHDHDDDMSIYDWVDYCIEIASAVYKVEKQEVFAIFLEAQQRGMV